MRRCGRARRRVDDEPEQDHHRGARELGAEAAGLAHGTLDVAAVDSAPDLADHDDAPAVLLSLAIEVHLDFVSIHGEEPAVELPHVDPVVLRRWYRNTPKAPANSASYLALFRMLSLEMWMRAFGLG